MLVLAVTRGPDAGARLVVTAMPKTVGRSRSADLTLTDRGVSRAHLEVSVVGGRLLARCLPGTAPLVVDGVEQHEASVPVGAQLVLSESAFTVLATAGTAPAEGTAQATELRGLLQGLAADVRSLRSVADLIDLLDRAAEPAAVAAALEAWARTEAGAQGLRVAPEAELRSGELAPLLESHAVLVLDRGRTATIAVAAHGTSRQALVVDVADPPARVPADLLRLLGVAGRIAGSAFARVEQRRALEADVASLRTLALGSARDFLGGSPAAKEVQRLLQRLAGADVTALIVGESGTGKSFVARLVHEASKRAREPFRVINCAAIPENLLESELFGHERGAFSGAVAAHAGAFEAAGRGTILLDEIGELALPSQAKLLRVLEERKFERVGSNRTQTVEARILAATNRDLGAMVESGRFRQDLFFRVSVVSVRVPPLRDRGEDAIVLARQLLADGAATAGRRITGFAPSALEAIRGYSWPGNVRELRNAIEHALVLGDTEEIGVGDLPETLRTATATAPAPAASRAGGAGADSVQLPARLDWLEERAIEAALRATNGNRAKAAGLLGINRVTLYKKLKAEPET